MEQQAADGWCQGQDAVLQFGLGGLGLGLERQIQNGEGQHDFGKTVGGFAEIGGKKGRLAIPEGVVLPEAVRLDQTGILVGNEELIVVVLGPFPGEFRLAEERHLIGSLPEEGFGPHGNAPTFRSGTDVHVLRQVSWD